MKTAKKTSSLNKATALERITKLETSSQQVGMQIEVIADAIDNLRVMVEAIAKRLNATIKSAEEGSISNDAVNQIITGENVKELEGKVNFLLSQKVLVRDDERVAGEKTFMVGRELSADKKVINPRTQFSVDSLDPELKSQILGHKVGDLIELKDNNGNLLEVTEMYKIQDPRIQKDFENVDGPVSDAENGDVEVESKVESTQKSN